MSNLFFFRDRVGYNLEDKFDRVDREHFSLGNDIVSNYVEEHGLRTQDLDDPGKNQLKIFLERKLEPEVFEELVDDLFDEHGEEGDTFNIKAYNLDTEIDKTELISNLEEFKENSLMDTGEAENFSYIVQINDFIEREEEGVVDISFHITGKQEKIPPDELFWQTEGGEEQSIEDVTEDPPEALNRTKDYMIETRIYSDAGLMAVSNSGIDKTLQAEIRGGIQRWGKTDGSR